MSFFRFFLSFALLGSSVWAGPLIRETNETLRLPASLPEGSFTTENAFETLSFRRPVALVTPPGETQRLFVVEQAGRIEVIPDLDEPSKETFLDLQSQTAFQGESGLLGLAFHPDYAENGFFYVFYTTTDGGDRVQRISRFAVDPEDANRALEGSEQALIDQRDDASNHNGGDLHFGPDGYLYISLGDEGGANDQFDNSRFIDRDFFSGILRIDVDQRPGSLPPNTHPGVYPGTYTVPSDNPFIGLETFADRLVDSEALRTEFWAVGLRNPWRMHFDGPTGRLFCADVGQSAREEVNLITRGGHYGWSFREGTIRFTRGPGGSSEPEVFAPIEPIWDYRRADGVSITGGVVYRGQQHTELYEAYIFGDFGSGQIWALHFNDDSSVRVEEIASDSQVSAFGTDPRNGDVLFTSYAQGQVKRIARKTNPFSLLIPSKLSRTGAFVDMETLTPEAGIVSYEPNVSFWSDGAIKKRWFSVPDLDDAIAFEPEKPWTFPVGTTWIKHFELEQVVGDPSSRVRLETRFLVKTETGSYGLTYAWNEEQTDADLVDAEGSEREFIVEEAGEMRTQLWSYPSRNACRACHTQAAGQALGFSTAQLNRAHAYPEGEANQLVALSDAGYFESSLSEAPELLVQLAPPQDTTRSLEDRARSYLAANCAQCHLPGGPALGSWDARFATSLEDAWIIEGGLVNDLGDSNNGVLVPGKPEHSMLLTRLEGGEGIARMPPIGSNRVDEAGMALLREWVLALDEEPTGAYTSWLRPFLRTQPELEQGLTADPDRDGQTNFQEYIANTHPGEVGDRWKAVIGRDAGGPYLTLPATPNGRTEIEESDDAHVWRPAQFLERSPRVFPDGSLQFPLGPKVLQRFYRFRLLEP